MREITIKVEASGERADKVICSAIEGLSRNAAQLLIEKGNARIGGRAIKKSAKLEAGDDVVVVIDDPQYSEIKSENIPLQISYEDDDLLVVNKAKGMVVHPAPGHYSGTLVNALLHHCRGSLSGINGILRPGIVHRIDKDTSGLLIVAKNDFAHNFLAEQIKSHSFERRYAAVVYGRVKQERGTINAPIGRHPVRRKEMAVIKSDTANSREAITHYCVTRQFDGFTQMELRLETGRTHQIRVHLAYISHPVAGDPIYGPKKVIASLDGQCLHAGLIGFKHPRTGRYMELTSPLPEYFNRFVDSLREWK